MTVLRLLVAAVCFAALLAFVLHGRAGHPVEPAPITIEDAEPVPYQGEQP